MKTNAVKSGVEQIWTQLFLQCHLPVVKQPYPYVTWDYCHYNVKIVDEIPWCYHSNNTSLVGLFHTAIYIKGFYKKKWVNFFFADERSERINIKRLLCFEFLKHPIFTTIDYLYDCMRFLLECDVWQMFLVVWFM